jgi:hypothetical protein
MNTDPQYNSDHMQYNPNDPQYNDSIMIATQDNKGDTQDNKGKLQKIPGNRNLNKIQENSTGNQITDDKKRSIIGNVSKFFTRNSNPGVDRQKGEGDIYPATFDIEQRGNTTCVTPQQPFRGGGKKTQRKQKGKKTQRKQKGKKTQRKQKGKKQRK